ncbi:bifunctional hydroxymethylpyrimidine kinase/phosphomethylpyrimidine kinase [Jatrophihabitans endophyticus]|uniref:bifunctional hydroxymethylpyrimidine kinase/phosphomethylpyrimidine kinase n=1 Tax=Jatrophihabitans endophyticus TaxID=1206085 RepID=UPI001A0CA248|nr:bifunctional hydroxymethylpyrimidine kinase/phosphomethylpyrimidine kinase [Jatrophihabitans endophyticus]MBE7187961.1 bifunctional hydroxymethylpyrimidine kinase/phosphomethylpyrimidine kinase [Jatrophihabitans endophyticus]
MRQHQPVTALTIAGSDSSGGAGAQADLRTFYACGVHGLSAFTAVTVQNSLGVSDFVELPPAVVAAQIEAVADDIGIGAAKTGMLASAPIMAAVAEVVRRRAIAPFVVDPVAASQHGDPLLRPEALEVLRTQILPLASLATPNLAEVRLLTGRVVTGRDEMDDAARAMFDLGPAAVLIKGGGLRSGDAVDVLYDGATFTEFRAPRIDTIHVHGSGDTLASATTAALARGVPLAEAIADAKQFVTRSVADGFPLGRGRGPVGHFWRLPAPD